MDAEGMVVEWSADAERRFGYPRAEALGRRLSDLVIPERHRAAHEAGLRRFTTGAAAGAFLDRPMKIAMLHREGREFEVTIRIGMDRTPEGVRFPAFIS